MKARISQLHKTEAEWEKYSQWIPEAGEIVAYDPDNTYPYTRVKVGDGKRTLSSLEFFVETAITEVLKKVRYETVIDGGRITEYPDNN
jgi:hypothetical protein